MTDVVEAPGNRNGVRSDGTRSSSFLDVLARQLELPGMIRLSHKGQLRGEMS